MIRRAAFAPLAAAALLLAAPAIAEPVGVTRDVMSVTVQTGSGPVEIKRVQDNDHTVSDEWARTSRPCPDFCIQPMRVAEGVTTIGELELLEMLQDPDAVVADSRTAQWFAGGAIPGAISIPYLTAADRLDLLGCEADFEGWDCETAKPVALYCNGPWCGQSPTAIRNMIAAGFPAEKISWYRGGMQLWRILGLTVTGEQRAARSHCRAAIPGLDEPDDAVRDPLRRRRAGRRALHRPPAAGGPRRRRAARGL